MAVNINSINQNSSYTQQKVDINTQWSGFTSSKTHAATGDVGRLLPGYWREVHPGEKFNYNFQLGVQFNPFVTNLFHTLTGTAYTYFVPYRILFDGWEEFITGGKTGQTSVQLPRFIPPLQNIDSDPWKVQPTKSMLVHTLWDYFGLPLQDFSGMGFNQWEKVNVDSNPLLPVAFPFLAYAKIYNEKYRYQDIENEYEFPYDHINGVKYNYTGSDWSGENYNKDFYPAFAHWNNDYFTRSRIYQQRGVTPLVPLSDDVVGNLQKIYDDPMRGLVTSPVEYAIKPNANNLFKDTLDPNASSTAGGNFNMLAKDVIFNTNGVGINVNDLSVAMSIQRYNINNARLQPKYQDQLRARFGAYPTDERLQEPEFLGSFNFNISVNQTTATASTTFTGSDGSSHTRNQGDITSQAYANANGNISYEAKEHGIVMTLFTIRPVGVYSQMMPRQLLHTTRFDYITPELANTPDVAIKQEELLWPTPNAVSRLKYASDDSNFGWTDIYSEYRTELNTVGGLLNPVIDGGLGSYTLARKFDSAPHLNAQFVQCCPDMKRILQYTNQPAFVYFARTTFSSTLPLPVRSEPLSTVI